MQFLDEAKIYVKSGKGGAGCLSFLRAANLPKGGPDGGNGGRGGSVILRGTKALNTLIDFRFQQHFTAENGRPGMGKLRSGASGEDLIVTIPVGTTVYLEDGELEITDIIEDGQELVIAKGGDGGTGNAAYKSSTNQAPRKTTPGFPGEEHTIWLKLKLLSDVGLVGLPNAGKSTLLSVISRAKPKIADYPFTTLTPQLGVVSIDGHEFVMADLPGLIKGAHEGQGLGDRFLKHIERCAVMLHLVDATMENPYENYQLIRHELTSYHSDLAIKPELIALTKCDSIQPDALKKVEADFHHAGLATHAISSIANQGTEAMLRVLYQHVTRHQTQAA